MYLTRKEPPQLVIIEAGHYYDAKGPTKWSARGWEIATSIKNKQDRTMLLVDDVHPITDVSKYEIDLPSIRFPVDPDFVVEESDMHEHAIRALNLLKPLHKDKRCRQGRSGEWFITDFPITCKKGQPTCVLFDTGLTIMKTELGFSEGINVLPFYYEREQRHLKRILKRIMPDFQLKVILFDISGEYWEMT